MELFYNAESMVNGISLDRFASGHQHPVRCCVPVDGDNLLALGSTEFQITLCKRQQDGQHPYSCKKIIALSQPCFDENVGLENRIMNEYFYSQPNSPTLFCDQKTQILYLRN